MKIVINRSDAIGDTLLTMPMAKALKEKFPRAKIVFIVSPRSRDLFLEHPYIDDYWILDHSNSIFSKFNLLSKKFKSFRPDSYFHVGGSHLPSIVAFLMKVTFRGGLKSKWSSFIFLNKSMRQKRSLVTMHESEYNMSLLEKMDVHFDHKSMDIYAPEIVLTPTEILQAKESFESELVKNHIDPVKPRIFIHPGMTGHTLNWAGRNYGRLVQRLEEEFPDTYSFIISHTPADERFLTGMKDHFNQEEREYLQKKVYFFDGALRGLRHYMAVLSEARVFIGPSTGTTHIANALGIPQVGIFSPIKAQSSLRWGPYHRNPQKVKVIVPDVVCGEDIHCAGATCPYYECMGKVEVEDVFVAVKELLENN